MATPNTIIIGESGATGAMTIGSSNTTTTTLKGTVVVNTKITAPQIDSTTESTQMKIGTNLTTGNLIIGGASPYTGNVDFLAGQTTGKLYFASGVRSGTAEINFGTGANASGSMLYIGHKGTTVSSQEVKINTSTGATGATTIGSSTSATSIGGSLSVTGLLTADGGITLPSGDTITVNGTISGPGNISTTGSGTITSAGLLTANGGLKMGGSNHITLTTASGTSPGVYQLGYATGRGPTTGTVTSTSTALVFANFIGDANGIGTYIVTYTVNTTGAWSGLTSGYITFSYEQFGGTVTMLGTPPLLSYSTGLNGVSWVVIVQVTVNGPGIRLNAITNALVNSVAVTSSVVFTKIA